MDIYLTEFSITFAVTTDGRVPFVRQFRVAVDSFTLELPSGGMEDGEDPQVNAARELAEEAGVQAASWQHLGRYIMDANHHCGWSNVYLAREATILTETPNSGDLGEMSVHFCLWLRLKHAGYAVNLSAHQRRSPSAYPLLRSAYNPPRKRGESPSYAFTAQARQDAATD